MNRSSTSSQPKVKARVLTPRGARTRQELLDAAEQVFGKRGFEKASIQEITRQAGVALGTFYVYFPHKEAIFIELVDELGLRPETMSALMRDNALKVFTKLPEAKAAART